MKNTLFFLSALLLVLSSCIKDDIIFDEVDPVVRIISLADTLAVGDTYLFEARYLNNVGQEEDQTIQWTSSDPTLLDIDADGLATGIQKGMAQIIASATAGQTVSDTVNVIVADNTTAGGNEAKRGEIRTTSSYKLQGSFTLQARGSGIIIEFADDYEASTALPGLYLYLTNNPNSIANAYEIGMVEVFNGAHSYEVPDVGVDEYSHLLYYCKPFLVKVGDGAIE